MGVDSVNPQLLTILQAQFGDVAQFESLQSLWAGYGDILRVRFVQGHSVVVKQICFSQPENHPRGWNTDVSHQRKLKSYRVEYDWYEFVSKHSGSLPKCASPLYLERSDTNMIIVMEDLTANGYVAHQSIASEQQIKSALSWLAQLHCQFLQREIDGVWQQGGYWHLATREQEWHKLPEGVLKEKAIALDSLIQQCQFKTVIHGDAKLANFCFNTSLNKAVAVDFQYIGYGIGVQDVMLLLSSIDGFEHQTQNLNMYLNYYFEQLSAEVAHHRPDIDGHALEVIWRNLYCVAWADFVRFLSGWSPQHKKLNAYSDLQLQLALKVV